MGALIFDLLGKVAHGNLGHVNSTLCLSMGGHWQCLFEHVDIWF